MTPERASCISQESGIAADGWKSRNSRPEGRFRQTNPSSVQPQGVGGNVGSSGQWTNDPHMKNCRRPRIMLRLVTHAAETLRICANYGCEVRRDFHPCHPYFREGIYLGIFPSRVPMHKRRFFFLSMTGVYKMQLKRSYPPLPPGSASWPLPVASLPEGVDSNDAFFLVTVCSSTQARISDISSITTEVNNSACPRLPVISSYYNT